MGLTHFNPNSEPKAGKGEDLTIINTALLFFKVYHQLFVLQIFMLSKCQCLRGMKLGKRHWFIFPLD